MKNMFYKLAGVICCGLGATLPLSLAADPASKALQQADMKSTFDTTVEIQSSTRLHMTSIDVEPIADIESFTENDGYMSISTGNLTVDSNAKNGYEIIVTQTNSDPNQNFVMTSQEEAADQIVFQFASNKDAVGKDTKVTSTGKVQASSGTILKDQGMVINQKTRSTDKDTRELHVFFPVGVLKAAHSGKYSASCDMEFTAL